MSRGEFEELNPTKPVCEQSYAMIICYVCYLTLIHCHESGVDIAHF